MHDRRSLRNAASLFALIPLVIASTATSAWAQGRTDEFRGYDDYVGPYAQFALSIGRIDFDGNIDSDASGGFGLTGGYRALPWLAAEAHFQFLGGQENAEIGNVDRDSQFFAFTFGPKIYPFAFLDDGGGVPETIQPYGFIGIGGGEAEIDGGDDEGTFVGRFILGVDVWIDDQFGVFVEGGGFAASDDDIDGAGVFSVGGQVRF